MVRNLKSTFVAWATALLACLPPVVAAQVDWKTTLNTAPGPITLAPHNVLAASDGAIYSVGVAYDGESNRVRVARISSAGVTQWTAWVGEPAGMQGRSFWAHPDNSVSVLSKDSTASSVCLENFAATGERRVRWCFARSAVDDQLTQAPDGDFYVATGQRYVRKVSPLGVVRWPYQQISYSTGPLYASGVDSAGNYFEIRDFYLRVFSSVDGARITQVPVAGQGFSSFLALPRANRNLVLVRGTASTPDAFAITLTRNDTSGAVAWTRQLIFPGSDVSSTFAIMAADADGTYVVRTSLTSGDSQIAKLGADGTVLWLRHYARIRQVIEGPSGLAAVRTDTSAANQSSDSFLFPVNPADGALGAPSIYSRADAFAPTHWTAVAGGFVGTFQGSNPFPPFAGFPLSLGGAAVFLESAPPMRRWTAIAEVRQAASVQQGNCLMPRLAKSGVDGWWARTEPSSQSLAASWTSLQANNGIAIARSPQTSFDCGSPITADAGQIVLSSGNTDRVKKLSAAGAAQWSIPALLTPAFSTPQALQTTAANGEITYAISNIIGRVSSTGVRAFESSTAATGHIPRYLAVDSQNNAWLLSGTDTFNFFISKVSPSGSVLWAFNQSGSSCYGATEAAVLTATDELLIAARCGDGASVMKFGANGQLQWQQQVFGPAARTFARLAALHADSAGNIYAGGCTASGEPMSTRTGAWSLLKSWTAAGVERWTAHGDLLVNAPECISAITSNAAGQIFAASSTTDANRSPALWSVTSLGVERWRHANALGAPAANATELVFDDAGKLLALGEALAGLSGGRETSLRRVNVSAIGTPLVLKVLGVPSAPIEYRAQFSIRVGLRTAADTAALATSDVVVNLGVQSGIGVLDGIRSCTITVGTSECVVADARYNAVEQNVVLFAFADGFASVPSAAIGFTAATTSTVVAALTPGPYSAYSVIRIRAETLGSPPSVTISSSNFYGPNSPNGTGISCVQYSGNNELPWRVCDLLLRTSSMPVSAQFTYYGPEYLPSSSAPTSFQFAPVTPTLQVTLDPSNTFVSGDRLRLRIALVAPSGVNVSPFVSLSSIALSNGGNCLTRSVLGSNATGYAGSYVLCEIPQPPAALSSVAVHFSGDVDLLPTGPVAQSIPSNPGSVVRGTVLNGGAFSVCSTNPALTCSVSGARTEWQCTGTSGMSGEVYLLPGVPYANWTYPNTPIRFSNVAGTLVTGMVTGVTTSSACLLDVDGDGARMSMTDGILILRRMLGVTGDPLTSDVTHACVPRTAAGIAASVNLAAYDIDGDGQTLPHTDGLLILRSLLGFSGDSLVMGAVGASAPRRSAIEIGSFLSNNCK
ncbi:MAG TPA: hypothetical protein PK586_06605 [Casimicrobium sp.]|nr:hypothetical protein [Casimicrobium sp.]